MSLINEALRKARLEASRREAAERGSPPPVDPHPAARGSRWPLAIAAVALAAAIGALLFLIGRMSAAPPAQAAVAESRTETPPSETLPSETPQPEGRPEAPAEIPGLAAGEPGAGGAGPAAAGSAAAVPERPSADSTPPARTAPRRPTAGAPATPRRPPSASPSPPRQQPTAAPSPAAAAPGAEPVRSYVTEVELEGIGRLELGGIAWSSERPFALLNGRLVGPGERILGLLVRDIQPGMVELEGDGERIRLTLR